MQRTLDLTEARFIAMRISEAGADHDCATCLLQHMANVIASVLIMRLAKEHREEALSYIAKLMPEVLQMLEEKKGTDNEQ